MNTPVSYFYNGINFSETELENIKNSDPSKKKPGSGPKKSGFYINSIGNRIEDKNMGQNLTTKDGFGS